MRTLEICLVYVWVPEFYVWFFSWCCPPEILIWSTSRWWATIWRLGRSTPQLVRLRIRRHRNIRFHWDIRRTRRRRRQRRLNEMMSSRSVLIEDERWTITRTRAHWGIQVIGGPGCQPRRRRDTHTRRSTIAILPEMQERPICWRKSVQKTVNILHTDKIDPPRSLRFFPEKEITLLAHRPNRRLLA